MGTEWGSVTSAFLFFAIGMLSGFEQTDKCPNEGMNPS